MTTIEEKAKEAWLDYEYRDVANLYSACFEDGYMQGVKEAMQNQWISVDEKLPELGERVLICSAFPRRNIFITKRIPYDHANLKGEKWHWSNVVDDKKVTHWMPIPPFPEVRKADVR